jgi:hypothetical protein
VGFPGAKPEAALKGYIRQNAHDSEFFHSAYPESSVHDVRESIELYERFEDSYDTEVGYEEFLARTQHGLGSKRAAAAVRAGG